MAAEVWLSSVGRLLMEDAWGMNQSSQGKKKKEIAVGCWPDLKRHALNSNEGKTLVHVVRSMRGTHIYTRLFLSSFQPFCIAFLSLSCTVISPNPMRCLT